jgi:hypothetical protein
MKRLTLLALAVAVALMAGCEGDNPSGPDGTLDVVTGLAIGDASTGVDVVLSWTAVADVDGYYVYWKANNSGDWVEVGDVTGTSYTHTATSAGTYSVLAYAGDDTSSDYSASVSTMPNVVSTEYSIYDNYAPADYHSGFIFGATSGETGLASSGAFVQDIYAYDPDTSPTVAWFYSGDYGPFGDGNTTWMSALGDGYDNPGAAPDASANWWDNGYVLTGDVIFGELFDGYFVKMYINDVYGPVGGSTNGTGVDFTYEFQPIQGLRLFTTNS